MGNAVAGQESPLESARTVNRVLDATAIVAQHHHAWTRQTAQGRKSLNTVEVKNISGSTLPRGSCVQLGTLLTDPDIDIAQPVFEADLPADPVQRKYVILREPLVDDAFGLAQAAGLCTALVDVSDAGHGFAVPVAADHVLASAVSGPIELLQDPDGTGEQELVVRLASAGGGIQAVEFEITAVGPPIDGDVVIGSATYAEETSVELTNPHGYTIEVGLTGFAIDFGDGTLRIENIICPPV